MALAGRVADGLVLVGGCGPSHVRDCLDRSARTAGPDFRVAAFASLCVLPEREAAHRAMAPLVAELLGRDTPCILEHPHADEIRERYDRGGADALADMPHDWWAEIGPIGTLDDAVAFTEQLADAGATDIAFFPWPELEYAYEDIGIVQQIAAAVR
jgi:hypothetical protein